MSTEQQEYTATDPVIVAIATEMLDGREFGHTSPARWRADIREAVPEALARMAARRSAVDQATDTDIGEWFFGSIREQGVPVTGVNAEQIGAWLRTKAMLVAGEPGGVPDYPTPPDPLLNGHEAHLAVLRVWADNPDEDVADGVDEQATALGRMRPRRWPYDGCETQADSKAFLGRVMDYKRARLAPLVPVEGMRLRVDERLNAGAYFVPGSEVGVVSTGATSFIAEGDCDFGGDGQISHGSSQSLRIPNLRQYHLVGSGPEPEVGVAEVAEAVEHIEITDDSEIGVLRREVESLRAEVRRLTTLLARATTDHETDIQIIGEALIEEARRRDWCSEYDRVIGSISSRLSIPLPDRQEEEVEHEVRVSGYLRVPFTVTVSVTATGDTDWDDITQQAGEDVEANFTAQNLLRDYADSYNAEVEDTDFDYERP